MVQKHVLKRLLEQLSLDVKELGGDGMTVRDASVEKITTEELSRLVGRNRPALFKMYDILGAALNLPAIHKWKSRDYLESVMKNQPITMTVTPNGLADAIVDNMFVLPHSISLPFQHAMDKFDSQHSTPWYWYIQSQNNNLQHDFLPLLQTRDIPSSFEWADACFGQAPDAVNFWMGNTATTSLHKDHYENIYMVITGKKVFRLYPPTDYHRMKEHVYDIAQYCPSDPIPNASTHWTIEKSTGAEAGQTPWLSLDPLISNDAPLTVQVCAGDILYLPSLWFHHVVQEPESLQGFEATIAVNYWYDMDYSDHRYSYFQFMRQIANHLEEEDEDESL